MGELLPSRAQWDAACRDAAAKPGSWHQVGASPWWVTAPVQVPPDVAVTVHGHTSDVAASVSEFGLRARALEGVDDALFRDWVPVEPILGKLMPIVAREELHAQTSDRVLVAIGHLDDDAAALERAWRRAVGGADQ